MLPLQNEPGLQVAEGQQICPGSPHSSQLPPEHALPASQRGLPLQQMSPSPPHGMHVPEGLQ